MPLLSWTLTEELGFSIFPFKKDITETDSFVDTMTSFWLNPIEANIFWIYLQITKY